MNLGLGENVFRPTIFVSEAVPDHGVQAHADFVGY